MACAANSGQVGAGYASPLAVSSGTGPFTYSINSGSLPPGLVLNTSTGAITGTPTLAGPFTFTGRVTDSLNQTAASPSCGITIAAATPPLVPDLTITKSHSGNFQQGGSGVYTLTVSNIGPGPTSGTVTVTDTLPAGLTATAISGTAWNCSLASRTCTRSDVLGAGATYPPITVTVNVATNLLGAAPAGNGPIFQPGDILLSLRDGTVQWRRHDWTMVKTLTNGTEGQSKGMAFDATGNLFVTHYFGSGITGNDVVKFDMNGNVIGLFGSSYDCNPSTVAFDKAGDVYIGHADCSGNIFKLDSQGNRLARFNVAVENRGSTHILLDPDQCTIYYTSEGRNVKRFNVCTNTQMPDFNNAPLPEAIDGAHQLAMLPGGGLLIADFSVIARLDASGNLVRTYNAPADTHCWLGMALDPDGTSFWASNWCDSSATRFDMATGNVIESHVAADPGFMVKQIFVVPADVRSAVVINTAAVSGGGDVNTGNNSASNSTTIVPQPQTPALSIDSTSYCVGGVWTLAGTNPRPNASVRLIGTTNGQPWMVPAWATTDANGSFSQGGTFTPGTEGSYTLSVEIDGNVSNLISFAVSNISSCGL